MIFLVISSIKSDKAIPYEGPSLANQIGRKLEVFDRKLEGNHYIFFRFHHFDICCNKYSKNVKDQSFSLDRTK